MGRNACQYTKDSQTTQAGRLFRGGTGSGSGTHQLLHLSGCTSNSNAGSLPRRGLVVLCGVAGAAAPVAMASASNGPTNGHNGSALKLLSAAAPPRTVAGTWSGAGAAPRPQANGQNRSYCWARGSGARNADT